MVDPSETLLVTSTSPFSPFLPGLPLCADLASDTLIHPDGDQLYFDSYRKREVDYTVDKQRIRHFYHRCEVVASQRQTITMRAVEIMFINEYRRLVLIGKRSHRSATIVQFHA